MIGFRNCGRLGNSLYMTAAMLGYAFKHELEYSVPNFTNDFIWNVISLQHLVNPKWQQGKEDILINEVWNETQHYQEIPFDESWRNQQIVLNGYWQSYKYIDPYRDEIIKAFNYPYEFNRGVCFLHIRRGDYLIHYTKHPTITKEYIVMAMNNILDCGVERFKIFSDDIGWCKDFFGRLCEPEIIEYSEGNTPEQDLILMANCEHGICSNSTLALWGAELNQNPNKIVIVPSADNWFGKDNKHLTVKDLLRPEFVQIKYTPIYEL